jgi:hypothetical protein
MHWFGATHTRELILELWNLFDFLLFGTRELHARNGAKGNKHTLAFGFWDLLGFFGHLDFL